MAVQKISCARINGFIDDIDSYREKETLRVLHLPMNALGGSVLWLLLAPPCEAFYVNIDLPFVHDLGYWWYTVLQNKKNWAAIVSEARHFLSEAALQIVNLADDDEYNTELWLKTTGARFFVTQNTECVKESFLSLLNLYIKLVGEFITDKPMRKYGSPHITTIDENDISVLAIQAREIKRKLDLHGLDAYGVSRNFIEQQNFVLTPTRKRIGSRFISGIPELAGLIASIAPPDNPGWFHPGFCGDNFIGMNFYLLKSLDAGQAEYMLRLYEARAELISSLKFPLLFKGARRVMSNINHQAGNQRVENISKALSTYMDRWGDVCNKINL